MPPDRSGVVPRVRVYDTLRTAHLERQASALPAVYLYRHRAYDWSASAAEGVDARPTTTSGLLRFLLTRRVDVLEVNEPLMRPGVQRAALACLAVTVADLMRRRRTTVVSYAIDNRDPYRDDRVDGVRSRTRRMLDRLAARIVWARLDRVAFGTPAAQRAYARALPPATRSRHALLPHLPTPCDCLAEVVDRARPPAIVFVGALSERKGVPQLLTAWPLVLEAEPDARLTILGTGELADEVLAAAHGPRVEATIEPSRAAIHDALRSARVVVLFSQPRPRWREQVGLPIVEALAHGATVVSSDETGLAEWLDGHGHVVLPAAAGPGELAAAIVGALGRHRPAADVLADLPAVDGRSAAERWLLDGGP